jgi:hypothetical protein
VALVARQLGEDRDVEPGVGYAGGEQLRTQRRVHPSGNLVRRGSVPEHDEHVQAFPVVDDLVLAQLSERGHGTLQGVRVHGDGAPVGSRHAQDCL